MLRKLFYSLSYLRKPPWDSGITPPEVYDFISANTPGRALDLGCGTGTNVITLAQSGWKVTGIDYVRKAIREAKHKARQAGVTADLIAGDVTRLDHLDGLYDLVLDIGCYHSLNLIQRNRYIQHIQRLLRPGCAYLLYAFINTEDTAQDFGLSDYDIRNLSTLFLLEKKQIGTDRNRPSAWFTFRKPIPSSA
jgi:2-polyprenyl-3-methyl-5-hydroxy-6-metoxy-1,4-benzoquinol methylase